ncbi:MAG: hypothetical protein FJX77_02300 [Armatimonadetes bacterium]|nr:hypothetical protein [Armatimonadota bacterium]
MGRGGMTAAVGIWLLTATAGWAAEPRVFLADGRVFPRANLKPAAAPDRIVVEPVGQPSVEIAAAELVVVDFGRVSGRTAVPTIRLANGDTLFGKLSFPTPRQVKVAAGWGGITVPLAWCSALRLGDQGALPEPTPRDTLFLANDRVEGEIRGVTGDKVSVQLGGKPVQLELARVRALALGPRDRGTEVRPGLLLSVDLGGGERLTGGWVKMDEDVLTLRAPWGQEVGIPVASVARLEVQNGKLVYLSTLTPSEARHVPYLDGTFPLRRDLAVTGRTMRLSGRAYARGVGMHSRSDATYSLGSQYGTFAATIGIDDAAGDQGSVVFRILGDEKLLYESPVLRGGAPPVEVKVDVRRVLLLRLEVDYADQGDSGDHADWAEARLLKE